jgi:hypothetical protein
VLVVANSDKRSSLLWHGNNYSRETFYSTGPRTSRIFYGLQEITVVIFIIEGISRSDSRAEVGMAGQPGGGGRQGSRAARLI